MAIAIDTGEPEVQLRIAHWFNTPVGSGYKGSILAFPYQSAQEIKKAYLWLPQRKAWSHIALCKQDGHLAFLYTNGLTAVAPPWPSTPVPQDAATSGFTVRWTGQKPPEPTIDKETVELRAKFADLSKQIQDLNTRLSQPAPKGTNRETWLQEQNELQQQLYKLNAEENNLYIQARNSKIQLIEKPKEAPAPTRTPEIFFATNQQPSTEGILASDQSFSVKTDGAVLKIDHQTILKACQPSWGKLRVWLTSTPLALNVTGDQPKGLTDIPFIQLSLSPADQFSEDAPLPNSASITAHGKRGFIANLPFPPAADQKESHYKARLFLRNNDQEPWMPSDLIEFKLIPGPYGLQIDWLTKSEMITLQADPLPQDNPNAALPIQSQKLTTEGLIHAAVPAAGGRFLVISQNVLPAVRVANLQETRWMDAPATEGDPSRIRIAADQLRLFVADRDGQRLRSISLATGETLATLEFPAAEPIITLAAGHSSEKQPLLVATRYSLRLVQPDKLRPIPQAFTQPEKKDVFPEPGVMDSIPWSAPWRDAFAIAAPDGLQFTISTSSQQAYDTLHVHTDGTSWICNSTQFGIPGWNGQRLFGESDSQIFPCLDRGCFSRSKFVSKTIPPTPSLISVALNPKDQAIAKFRAGSAAVPIQSNHAPMLWFDLAQMRMISAGGHHVMIETLEKQQTPPASTPDTPTNQIPASSNPPSQWQVEGATPAPIPATTFPIPHTIEKLLLGGNGKYLIATAKSGSHITVVDLSTLHIIYRGQSTGGPASVTANASALYLWHYRENLLEKRSFASPNKATYASFPDAPNMMGMSTGYAAQDQPIFCFFALTDRTNQRFLHAFLDPDKLTLSPLSAPEDFNTSAKDPDSFTFDTSKDGTKIVISRTLLTRRPGAPLVKDIVKELEMNSRLSDDGTIGLSNEAFNMMTKHKWNPPTKNCILIPARGSNDILLISGLISTNERNPLIEFLDGSTKKSLGKLNPIPEWDKSVATGDTVPQLVLWSASTKILVTTDTRQKSIILRKLPVRDTP